MKILYQQLWEEKLGWGDPVPTHYQARHRVWRDQLQALTEVQLPRCYFATKPTLTAELHGFSDASEAAVAAVVYIRATYASHKPTCRLVMVKTKVAPVETLSMPRLELNGAVLLAKLLTTMRNVLKIPIEHVHAWSDSSIVIAWLYGSPKRYKTFVGNRIASITRLVPPSVWPTDQNLADCVSRGLSPIELKQHSMWWKSSHWLALDKVKIPKQLTLTELSTLSDLEAKPVSCNIITVTLPVWIEHRYSSYIKLVHVTVWIIRAANNLLAESQAHTKMLEPKLSTAEVKTAEEF